MTRCVCGDTADNVISLAPEVHQRACSLCATQWALVVSAIKATDKRSWDIRDFRRWQDSKRAA